MTGADAPPIGIVVLAAGSSTRLGRPKQLVPYRGHTLLHHAARTALDAALGPVLVVLGAESDACGRSLAALGIATLVHPGWREGMGSTISAGTMVMGSDAAVGALILTACDLPGVSAADLQRLAEAHRRTHAAVVGSAYAGTVGIPALFARSRFPALVALGRDEGARAILRAEKHRLVSVPCPSAARDIDLESDTIGLE